MKKFPSGKLLTQKLFMVLKSVKIRLKRETKIFSNNAFMGTVKSSKVNFIETRSFHCTEMNGSILHVQLFFLSCYI